MMKYNELDKLAKDNDIGINHEKKYVYYRLAPDGSIGVRIDTTEAYKISIDSWDSSCFDLIVYEEFIRACIQLAKTPLSDREDTTRYNLRHKFIKSGQVQLYLAYNQNENTYSLEHSRYGSSDFGYQVMFLEREINVLKDKGFDLTNFEKIEVEDE